jgi:hypothetical protein
MQNRKFDVRDAVSYLGEYWMVIGTDETSDRLRYVVRNYTGEVRSVRTDGLEG